MAFLKFCYCFVNIKGCVYIWILISPNLHEVSCIYRDGWLCNLFGCWLRKKFEMYVYLSTKAKHHNWYQSPQTQFSLFSMPVVPLHCILEPLLASGQSCACPLPTSCAHLLAPIRVSWLLRVASSPPHTPNGLEGSFGAWVQFFLIGWASAFVETSPNLSADTIERKVQPGLNAS